MLTSLILTVSIALSQQVGNVALVSDPVLETFGKRSVNVSNSVSRFVVRSTPVYGPDRIKPDAMSFSQQWTRVMLQPSLKPTDEWHGYVSATSDREHLVRRFQSEKADVTWSDAILGVALHSRTADAYVLVSNEEAQEYIEGRLQDILKLPRIPAGSADYKLFEHDETIDGRPIWSGYVNRNVIYGEPRIVGGKESLSVLGILEWHHNLFVVTDGRTIVIRTRLIDGSTTPGRSPHPGSTGITRFIKGALTKLST